MVNLKQVIVVMTVCFLVTRPAICQRVAGHVSDESDEPIAFATVYLANTSVGTITSASGDFLMMVEESGKYDLVVSCVGYKRLILPMALTADSTYSFMLQLEPDLLQLDEVLVVPDSAERARYMPDFRGTSIRKLPK